MNSNKKYQNIIPEIPTTALDIYQMLPEGTRCDVIFNELIMSPSPSKYHQTLLIKLTTILYSLLEETHQGTLLTTPFDVYFEQLNSVVQPDLFIVLKESENIIKRNGVFGAPEIVIEIMSSNRAYDTQRKRALYEQAGVKEYFMIDPENRQTTLLTIDETHNYQQVYDETGVFKSALLDCRFLF
jgi:Uma2 family endonuclease